MMLDRTAYLTELCRDAIVIHLGCADWPYTERRIKEGNLLHVTLSSVARSIIGVDLSKQGIEMLQQHRPDWSLVCADASTYTPQSPPEVVVLSEVLEHVENPGDLLRQVRRWADLKPRLVITTPNGFALKGAIRAMVGREYAHPDHVVAFTTKTLTQLLERTGWHVESVAYYHVRSRRMLASIASGVVRLAANTILSERMGDGLIALARPMGL